MLAPPGSFSCTVKALALAQPQHTTSHIETKYFTAQVFLHLADNQCMFNTESQRKLREYFDECRLFNERERIRNLPPIKRGILYHFRVFVGLENIERVAKVLNEDLRFRAFPDAGLNGKQNKGTVWGTVEMVLDGFPPDSFRTLTLEILGYALPRPIELRQA